MAIFLTVKSMAVILSEINLTPEQRVLLKDIHNLAKRMEYMNNQKQAHALIAILEELSNHIIDPSYLKEKLNLLFKFDPRWECKY